MGSYNETKFCNMVGLLLLNEVKTTKLFKNVEFGTFRDNGLTVIQSKIPRRVETSSKSLKKIKSNILSAGQIWLAATLLFLIESGPPKSITYNFQQTL